MTFRGRQRELQLLEDAWVRPESAFIPIYGRRRVGKSALILELIQRRAGLYFVGKQAPAVLQIREFLEVAARAVGEPLVADLEVNGWGRALETVVGRWRGPGKLILALDEFQWMAEQSPELPSVLQELWDRQWKASGQVLLILCGSYIGFIEREILGQKSPLFGRQTANIHLRPFGYQEARSFHPSYSLTDAARCYFACGGIPQYLLCFDASVSVESNLQNQLFSEFAALNCEPDFLLREELREVHNYYAILTALAKGFAPGPELARRTGVAERSISYYLNQLEELGYVRRHYPLIDGPPVARHIRFRLDDPLLRFGFRFLFPQRSLLARMGPQSFFQQMVEPHLDSYFGSCFEALCREALVTLYAREQVNTAFEIGEYWDKNTQIDVVGRREDNWTDVGECKWGKTDGWSGELEKTVQAYPNARNATIGRRLFVRTRPKGKPPQGTRIHDLEDLYG